MVEREVVVSQRDAEASRLRMAAGVLRQHHAQHDFNAQHRHCQHDARHRPETPDGDRGGYCCGDRTHAREEQHRQLHQASPLLRYVGPARNQFWTVAGV